MAQLLDLVNRCAVLRRVCRRLLIPSRGPLKRLVWCQFRISSAQLRMVFAVCRTREWPRSRIGQRSVQECPGHSGGHRPDKGRRALVERPRPPEDADKFQQDLLKRVALDYPISFSTPIELSSLFGASIHATFRRWLEGLDAAACGLVLDANLTQGRRKRYEQVLTTQWKQQFGPYRFPRMMSPPHTRSPPRNSPKAHSTSTTAMARPSSSDTKPSGHRTASSLCCGCRNNRVSWHGIENDP